MPATPTTTADVLENWSAMEECIRRYASKRREQVDPFCLKYYAWKGTLKIHAETIREDLATNPLNTLWSVPFVALKSSCDWARKLGWSAPNQWLGVVPSQLKTGSQKRVEWLLLTELLQLPFDLGVLKSRQDALAEEFHQHPRLAPLRNDPEWKSLFLTDPRLWKKELAADSADRSSAADLASTATTLLTGWYLFGSTSMGIFDMGDRYAHRMARKEAVSHFFLGPKMGSVYYNFFPKNPTHTQVLIATVLLMAAVAAFSVVIHALIDPIHQMMGLHQKRLNHFIDALEERLLANVRTEMAAKLLATGHRPESQADPVQLALTNSVPAPIRS